MDVATIRDLHRYNDWAMERVLTCAGAIAPEEFIARNDTPWGSIRNQLAHVMDVHRRWLNWADGTMSGEEAYRLSVDHEDYPDVDSLRRLWTSIQDQTHEFLARMTPEDVQRDLTYSSADYSFSFPVGKVMIHLVFHAMQHRSEAAMALTRLGESPGDIDYLFYTIEQDSARTAG